MSGPLRACRAVAPRRRHCGTQFDHVGGGFRMEASLIPEKSRGRAFAAGAVGGARSLGHGARARGRSRRLASSFPEGPATTIYRRCRSPCPSAVAAATDGKFRIQVFAARRNRTADLGVVDAVPRMRYGPVPPTPRDVLQLRQGSDVCAFMRPCRSASNARGQNAWMYHGGGLELMREFYKEYNVMPSSRPAIPAAQMGGLVPQGNQDRRRPQGPEVPRRRLRRARC